MRRFRPLPAAGACGDQGFAAARSLGSPGSRAFAAAAIVALSLTPPIAPSMAHAAGSLVLVAKQMLQQVVQNELRQLATSALRGGGTVQRDCGAFAALGAGGAGGRGGLPMPTMQDAGALAASLGQMPPEQRALLAPLLAAPPSREQMLATLDDMGRLGMGEAEDLAFVRICIDTPGAAPMLALMLGPMRAAIDEMRQARAQLDAASPAERQEMVAQMAAELRSMDAEERQSALRAIGRADLLPAWLSEGVSAALR